MKEFDARVLQVPAPGVPGEDQLSRATVLEPQPFDGRVSERDLERWLLANPNLAGEPLFPLGQQLSEFEEDRDRLDLLAVDQAGEVVVMELKVDPQFRVTDLQGIAYAGVYSSHTPEHFARGLLSSIQNRDEESLLAEATGLKADATLEDVKSSIADFLGYGSFEKWEPSKQIRVKLFAPGFPKRVLKTVQWLGDVYAFPIEAIQVTLFVDGGGSHHLTFERLLPLPGADAFDLTVREQEDKRRTENQARSQRRPRILPVLLEHGVVGVGQRLWLTRDTLPPGNRDLYDADGVGFSATIELDGELPKLRWQPSTDEASELLSASVIPYRLCSRVLPDPPKDPYNTPVATHFAMSPDGPTLEQAALEAGLWQRTNGD